MVLVVVMQFCFYHLLLYWHNDPQANYTDSTGAQTNASSNPQTKTHRKEN